MPEKKEEMEKKEIKSDAWLMIEELGKQNKRMFIALVVVIALWFTTIGCFVKFLSYYDISTDVYDVTSEDGGFAGYIGNDGDMSYGTSASN